MKQRVILHIGSPKVASSYIQSTLFLNEAYLRGQKILYPRSGMLSGMRAHHNLAYELSFDYKLKDKFKNEIGGWSALRREVLESNCNDIFISTEALFRIKYIAKVAEFLNGFDVTVLICLRRQDEFFDSAMNQLKKFGRVDKNIDTNSYSRDNRHLADYYSIISRWMKHFDNVLIYPLNNFTKKYDIVAHLFYLLKLDAPDLIKANSGGNKRVGMKTLSALEHVTLSILKQVPDYIMKNTTRFRIIEVISKSESYTESLNLEQRKSILAYYDDGNKKLANELNNGGPLFDTLLDMEQGEPTDWKFTEKEAEFLERIIKLNINSLKLKK